MPEITLDLALSMDVDNEIALQEIEGESFEDMLESHFDHQCEIFRGK